MSVPTRDQIEDYIESIEEYVSTSFTTVAPDIQAITDAINRLWFDITRFGPPELPSLQDIPGLGNFEIPPPRPLPPPPELTWMEEVQEWTGRHRLTTAAVCVGLGLAVAYGAVTVHSRSRAQVAGRRVRGEGVARRKVVVVLGGDTPLGPPLIAGLEKEGYIVITSVASTNAVSSLESTGNGYVRALVLDPAEPSTVPMFLRSLQATLALKFPLHVAGDPYHSTSTAFPYIHSIISLLSLPTPDQTPVLAPLEHLNIVETYTPYLQATHIVPLRAIQGLLPLFRVAKPQQQRPKNRLGLPNCIANLFGLGSSKTRSIIICVPAPDALIGIPFASAQAMSAAATVRGAEVLRRELAAVSTVRSDDDSGERYRDAMSNIKVVVVDVGVVGSRSPYSNESDRYQDAIDTVHDWTPTERLVYGDAFDDYIPASRPDRLNGNGARKCRRRPTSVQKFVNTLVLTVGRMDTQPIRGTGTFATASLGLRLWYGNWKRGLRGERFSLGAGARTYQLASFLPTFLLDTLLNLPTLLVSIRNRYTFVEPASPPLERLPSDDELAQAEDGTGSLKLRSESAARDDAHEDESMTVASKSSGGRRVPSLSAEAGGHANISSSTTVDASWISVQDHD